ncbi:putative suppressor of SWI4 1 like protein [Cricetulus griseus]|uniref:Putative suppressor of SWI4 1 like protein n=1 Tax=Cricetulus griseus TaxID=10029 RepID=A0A061I7C1_CRIGR|nr:putative suppressor of SWI4 1 like protein [Cricetulus griseus]
MQASTCSPLTLGNWYACHAGAGLRQAVAQAFTVPTGDCPEKYVEAAEQEYRRFQEGYLWAILMAEFLVAVGGNGLALFRFITQEQRPWNPAVVFSAQLAVSNLCYSFTLPPLAAYFYPPKNWSFGEVACRLERFVFTCNLLGGIIFITCISLSRYMVVVHPFFTRRHLRPKHAWVISAASWAMAILLAAPMLGFSHQNQPQSKPGSCNNTNREACVKCLGMMEDSQIETFRNYSLVLACLGGILPLLLTLMAYSALGSVVLRSLSMTTAQKLHVVVLVTSGVALYACSYVPYHITQVLYVNSLLSWKALCPGFSTESQAKAALNPRAFFGYQTTRILVPLATCMHPLLYMAVAPSLNCHSCHGDPEDQSPHQDLPLASATTSQSQLSPEASSSQTGL